MDEMMMHLAWFKHAFVGCQPRERFAETRHEPLYVLQKMQINHDKHRKAQQHHNLMRFTENDVDLLYVAQKCMPHMHFQQNVYENALIFCATYGRKGLCTYREPADTATLPTPLGLKLEYLDLLLIGV